jgi:hypothetical protein
MKRLRKKNIIPSSRLAQLKAQPVVYEIRCGTVDCPCGNPAPGCERGFFSLFIQAINGIAFSIRFNIPYYVNFGHNKYAYSQPGSPDRNFWNYYFDQPIKNHDNPDGLLVNELIETYPLRIWDRSFFKDLSAVMRKELIYKKDVDLAFSGLRTKFQGHHVLGVHVRSTDHSDEILPVKLSRYFNEIDKRLPGFDKLFLATDDDAISIQFSERYGNKLLLNEVTRSKNGRALHMDNGIGTRYQLGLDALVECYGLSQCQEAILTQSNLSYAALLFNPDLKYKLLERLPTRIKKLQTLMLYRLDKWNIRKW